MSRPNPIRSIMESPLPSITYQRHLQFRPTYKDINYSYNIINRHIFNNVLHKPKIKQGRRRATWGFCTWELEKQKSGSWCTIHLSDKWFCAHWFIQTLAHEMVHQYQWDKLTKNTRLGAYSDLSGAHGPSFFEWREQFGYYGLDLKIAHGCKRWFRHQDFAKC